MFDYLQQFESLPKDLKDKVSSKEVMASLAEIESRYRVDLAMIIMKVMIKGLSIKDLPSIFIGEFGLSPDQAERMMQELKEKIFISVADYVGLSSEHRALDLAKDINVLIKEAGLAMPSEFLIERLNKILATYLRGVRSRIDTRASLTKDIATGGLNLTAPEVDRVLKVCDSQKFKYSDAKSAPTASTPPPISRLDKIVSSSDGIASASLPIGKFSQPTAEYDLKKALASGETKRIAAPVVTPVAEVKPIPEIKSAPVVKATPEINKEPVIVPVPKLDQASATIHKPENNSFLKKIFSDKTIKSSEPLKIDKASGSVRLTGPTSVVPIVAIMPTPIIPVAPVAPAAPTSPASARKSILGDVAPSSSRPVMRDVKPAPKIMGPLEEIQFLDLMNFRRLGKTPEEITIKVFNKIKLLERDGYEKMIAGISAWRKSPVSRLYLHIVQEAVMSNLPLKEAIEKREKNKQEGLTLAEIEAIMNLNSKLIF